MLYKITIIIIIGWGLISCPNPRDNSDSDHLWGSNPRHQEATLPTELKLGGGGCCEFKFTSKINFEVIL